jgi:hypothetical protein
MSLESELYARLSGYGGLSALVGTRIYPVRLPQNVALPAVTFQKVTAIRPSNFGVDTGDVRYRIQIDCWASAMPGETAGANKVAAQVRAALKRYRGGNIQDCFLENEQDFYDDSAELYRVILDFVVWFKE